MPENKFDLLVVGGGPAGYVAAIRGSQLGMQVGCIEEENLGGVCLNVGCIPTKAMLSSALLVNECQSAESHGIIFDGLTSNLAPAQKRSRDIAEKLANGVSHLFKKNKIEPVSYTHLTLPTN